jgi:hypothetical protein
MSGRAIGTYTTTDTWGFLLLISKLLSTKANTEFVYCKVDITYRGSLELLEEFGGSAETARLEEEIWAGVCVGFGEKWDLDGCNTAEIYLFRYPFWGRL